MVLFVRRGLAGSPEKPVSPSPHGATEITFHSPARSQPWVLMARDATYPACCYVADAATDTLAEAVKTVQFSAKP